MSVFESFLKGDLGISEEQLEMDRKCTDDFSKKYQKFLAGELTEEEFLGKSQNDDMYGFSEITCIEGRIR